MCSPFVSRIGGICAYGSGVCARLIHGPCSLSRTVLPFSIFLNLPAVDADQSTSSLRLVLRTHPRGVSQVSSPPTPTIFPSAHFLTNYCTAAPWLSSPPYLPPSTTVQSLTERDILSGSTVTTPPFPFTTSPLPLSLVVVRYEVVFYRAQRSSINGCVLLRVSSNAPNTSQRPQTDHSLLMS